MPGRREQIQDVVVTFKRIGQDTEVPDLRIAGRHPEIVQQNIAAFVRKRLRSEELTLQLWDENQEGFIDLGTHSAGTFTIRPFTPETEQ